jgi:hypothetical protein
MQQKTKIPQELQNKVYTKFSELPLSSALVVYARLVHGNSFKAQDEDLFCLNRRLASKIYRDFLESIKNNLQPGEENESEEDTDN